MNTTNNAAALERLAAIGELIRTQDNRITDAPIFIVQQKRVRVADPDYDNDGIVWVDDDNQEAGEADHSRLEAAYPEEGEPEGWRRLAIRHEWEFVTACFTEQGCKDYIARDGHNLREPRIYAAGSYRNEEWRAVREYLATLAQPDATRPRAIWPDALSSPERHQLRALLECVDRRVLSLHEADQLVNLIADALTSQPSGEAVDTGNYIHDPLYEALDELYGRGWTDHYKGRDYDPRGTNEWQAVLDLFRKYRTHPSADAPGVAVTDEMIERALEAYHDVYDAEYLANGLMRDNNNNAMRAALSAALAPKPEGSQP